MSAIPCEFDRSVRRSPLRLRVLLTLSSLGEAYAGQLARATGMRWTRVVGALEGRMPEYRDDLSLVALGLARVEKRRHGRVFVITNRGRRKARSVVAARTRGRRGVKERVTDPLRQVADHVAEPDAPSGGPPGGASPPPPPPPLAPAHVAWSFTSS